jgi:hypothetical protein
VTDGFLTLSRWAQCTCTEGNYGALGCMRFEPSAAWRQKGARAAVAQGQKSKSPELSEGLPVGRPAEEAPARARKAGQRKGPEGSLRALGAGNGLQ